MQSEYLEAGQVVGTHGIQGELRLLPWCDSADFLCRFKMFYRKDGTTLKVLSARPHKTLLLVRLEGIETVETADAMRGQVLYFAKKDANLPKGAYFRQDLIGLSAVDADTGKSYGILTDILETGANDVYEITDEKGEKHLMPAVKEMVESVHVEEGILKIRPIGGIFDEN